MKRFIEILFVTIIGALFVGCSYLSSNIVPKAVSVVDKYCHQPQSERLLLRQTINSKLAPNSIQVNCAADNPAP